MSEFCTLRKRLKQYCRRLSPCVVTERSEGQFLASDLVINPLASRSFTVINIYFTDVRSSILFSLYKLKGWNVKLCLPLKHPILPFINRKSILLSEYCRSRVSQFRVSAQAAIHLCTWAGPSPCSDVASPAACRLWTVRQINDNRILSRTMYGELASEKMKRERH
jgi:hypothetical protein